MTDSGTNAIAALLSALRSLPVWMFSGLAAAGYVVLLLPPFAGIDPRGFRAQWGIWVWIGTIVCSSLALARAVDSFITAFRLYRKNREANRPLRFVPLHQQCWWHLAKQQDDSFVTQICVDIQAVNLTDRPIRIIKARIIRPKAKGEILDADVSLPKAGSPYHSSTHPIPPNDTVRARLHVMVRGALGKQGLPLTVTFGITDQFGDEYRVGKLSIRTHDLAPPPISLDKRLIGYCKKLPGLRPGITSDAPPPEWQHKGAFENVDVVLNEEKRAYAARGRIVGGLGSLNTGLQSEPNFGGTSPGQVPPLLWDHAHAAVIDSPNLKTLLKFHETFDDMAKDNVELYLLSHLHKASVYAEVAYFVFLALHRVGRTVDALQAARSRLSGDEVNAYSNVLGVLSAIVSREHFDMDPELYPKILRVLEGDTEHNFRLSEKINLARLQQLDAELQEIKPPASAVLTSMSEDKDN